VLGISDGDEVTIRRVPTPRVPKGMTG
jgi:hypothetical protein